MKVVGVLFVLLLLSTTYQADAIVGKIIVNAAKAISKRIKQIGNNAIDGAAATIVVDKVSDQYNKWADKVSKTASVTPKPKPTAQPGSWKQKVKSETKSNCPQNRKREIQR
jgi:hypothetical protein